MAFWEAVTYLHSPERPTTTVNSHLVGMNEYLMAVRPSCATSQGPFVNPPFSSWYYSSSCSSHTCRTKQSSISVIFGSSTPPFRSGAGPSSSVLPVCHRSTGLTPHRDQDRRQLRSCVWDPGCEVRPVTPPFSYHLWLGIRPEIHGFAGFR